MFHMKPIYNTANNLVPRETNNTAPYWSGIIL